MEKNVDWLDFSFRSSLVSVFFFFSYAVLAKKLYKILGKLLYKILGHLPYICISSPMQSKGRRLRELWNLDPHGSNIWAKSQ